MQFSISAIQTRLKELGFQPGPVDGIRGKRTINAIKAFQKSRSLRVDGIAGANTHTALFRYPVDASASPDQWPWLTEGLRVLGWHEVTDNLKLRAWLASDNSALGDPAKLPWCGDFAETCILRALPDEPVPPYPYFARNWASWGVACEPTVGAVLVFERGPNAGHVGFYIGETKDHYIVLGGNQSNRVTRSKIAKRRLLASRWPSTVAIAGAAPIMLDDAEVGVSLNEA